MGAMSRAARFWQRLRTDVDRVPAGMVVEDDDLVGSAGQEPACSGCDVRLHLRSPIAPVRRLPGEDGPPVVELRDPLHVSTKRDAHPPTLTSGFSD